MRSPLFDGYTSRLANMQQTNIVAISALGVWEIPCNEAKANTSSGLARAAPGSPDDSMLFYSRQANLAHISYRRSADVCRCLMLMG